MASTSTFNKASWVAMKGLDLLLNKLQVAPNFSTEYSGEYAQKFAIGANLTVPLSQRYTVQQNDMTYNPQALDRPYTTITVDQTRSIAIQWESIEKALDMERGEEHVEKLYLDPMVAYMRQEMDSYCAQFAYQNTNMVTGALGTNPATFDATSAVSKQFLDEMGANTDSDDLALCLPPAVVRAVKGGSVTYFNPQMDISKQQRTGNIGKSDSFDWYASNSLYTHTTGVWATQTGVTVNGNGQSGSSLNITCANGDTFKQGDKISIAAVNQVNLMTRRTTSTSAAGTKTVTLTADVTATATTATLPIYPPIYGPGSHYQNVDALPVTGAVLTLWPGTTMVNATAKSGKVGLAFAPGAFYLAHLKLEEPTAVEFCRQYQDPKTGVALRVIRQWDNIQSRMTTRADMLFGAGIGLAEQCVVAVACA